MTSLIYGRNPVLESLRSHQPVERLLLAEGIDHKGVIAEIIERARAAHIPVEKVDRQRLDGIAPSHQGIVALMATFEYVTVDAMLELAEHRGQRALLLALDQVQDVHNLGSLIRTAEAVGAHGVIIPKRRAAGVTGAVFKSSSGAASHLPIAEVVNLVRTLRQLQEEGLWIVGLDMAGDRDYDTLDWAMPTAIVVGSEGRGLSRLARETCDFLVRLPMRGRVDSLNAAVAGSIVMYTAWRHGAGQAPQ